MAYFKKNADQVEQPTDWCAGIEVVPKSNGTLHICVNLTNSMLV